MTKHCSICNVIIEMSTSKFDLVDGLVCGECLTPLGCNPAHLSMRNISKVMDTLKMMTVEDIKTVFNGNEQDINKFQHGVLGKESAKNSGSNKVKLILACLTLIVIAVAIVVVVLDSQQINRNINVASEHNQAIAQQHIIITDNFLDGNVYIQDAIDQLRALYSDMEEGNSADNLLIASARVIPSSIAVYRNTSNADNFARIVDGRNRLAERLEIAEIEQPEYIEPEPETLSFGDTFAFNNFEITFHDNITWHIQDNIFIANYGADIFRVPMTIRNLGDESRALSFLYWTLFSPSGVSINNISTGDCVFSAGSMRPSATLNTHMNFLFDRNGTYWVEFNPIFGGETIEVRLPIVKP